MNLLRYLYTVAVFLIINISLYAQVNKSCECISIPESKECWLYCLKYGSQAQLTNRIKLDPIIVKSVIALKNRRKFRTLVSFKAALPKTISSKLSLVISNSTINSVINTQNNFNNGDVINGPKINNNYYSKDPKENSKEINDLKLIIKQKEAEETKVGILSANEKSFFLNNIGQKRSIIEIGNSGALFSFDSNNKKNNKTPFDSIFGLTGTNFDVVQENGQVKVSLLLFDKDKNLVVELIKNEWKTSDRNWDRNYTKDLLEVKNSKGDVVLQLQVLQDRIRIHLILYDINGEGRAIVSNGPGKGASIYIIGPEPPTSVVELVPLFKYPSKLHLGERVNNTTKE